MTETIATAAQSGTVRWALLIEIDYSNAEMVAIWTGIGDRVIGGVTYKGLGEFGGVSTAEESAREATGGVTYTLSAPESGYVDAAVEELLGSDFAGRDVRLKFVFFDEADAVIGTPILLRTDISSTVSTVHTKDTARMLLVAEPPFVVRGESAGRVYSSADQLTEFAGDVAFQNIDVVGTKPIVLG